MGEPLFDVAPPAPLAKPELLDTSSGKITYERYTAKRPEKCDDCNRVSFEANRAGKGAPLARTARVVRRQGALKLLICSEHQQLRLLDELELAVKAELDAQA